jgi:hypothetical protein
MQREIEPGRHVTCLNFRDNRIGRVHGVIPFRKIEIAAAFVDVALGEPGDRRDVRIPGPDSFIAVAVETGALCEFARARVVPRRFLNYGGVGVFVAEWNQLQQRAREDEPDRDFSS